ncbi:hypothetical protein [Parasphingorhabdus sp.]|uniref:hypothetical protein n=1 Tax=Parasphingorhabdus sp. TaxID=2709688 RepID=UPI0030034BA0
MDQIEQDLARFRRPVMAAAGGIAAALVVATLPHVYLEDIVGATGLSEIVPAAAPPLGNTARGLITVVAGLISASAIYLFLSHKTKSHEGGSAMGLAMRKNMITDTADSDREDKSRFAVPKLNFSAKSLTRFLKKPKKSPGQVTDLKDLPDIRSADRHPDAPARQPIFASSDLGAPLAEKIQRFDQPLFDHDGPVVVAPAEQQATVQEARSSDAPSRWDEAPAAVGNDEKAQADKAETRKDDLSALTLAQLADRLEAGLSRLDALQMAESDDSHRAQPAPSPVSAVSASPEPVSIPPLRSVGPVADEGADNRQADMDAALKAALGTLERMTAQR